MHFQDALMQPALVLLKKESPQPFGKGLFCWVALATRQLLQALKSRMPAGFSSLAFSSALTGR